MKNHEEFEDLRSDGIFASGSVVCIRELLKHNGIHELLRNCGAREQKVNM